MLKNVNGELAVNLTANLGNVKAPRHGVQVPQESEGSQSGGQCQVAQGTSALVAEFILHLKPEDCLSPLEETESLKALDMCFKTREDDSSE